jgi:hypothetical protein
MTTGTDLRLERKRLNYRLLAAGLPEITVAALAQQMGCSRQWVYDIEKAPQPKPVWVTRYRNALAALDDASMASGTAA